MKRHPLWDRIILAADMEDRSEILETCRRWREWIRWVKLGPIPFVSNGPDLVETLRREGFRIFLDLKFHDIPHTLAGAVRSASRLGVDMVNVHALSGPEGLEAAVSAREQAGGPMILVAVTVLTSHDRLPWDPQQEVQDAVLDMASWAHRAGLDGVVCSPHEVESLKSRFGSSFLAVTPGIRWQSPAGDQKRWTTPWEAFRAGADYLVMGRSLIGLSSRELQELNRRLHAIPNRS